MAFECFGKNSGPSVPPRTHTPFGNFPPNPSPPNPNPFEKRISNASLQQLHQQQGTPPQLERPAISPSWGNQRKQLVNHSYTTNHRRISPVAAFATAHDAEANFPSKPINPQVVKRTRSPPLASRDNSFLENYSSTNDNTRRLGNHSDMRLDNGTEEPLKRTRLENHLDMRLDNGTEEPSKGTRSPPLVFESNHSVTSVQNLDFSHEEAQRHDVFLPREGSQRKSPVNNANSSPHPKSQTVKSYSDTYDAGTLSPPRPAYFNAPKGARSPIPSEISSGSSSIQLDSQREVQAKAKRLARFNVELRQPLRTPHDLTRHKSSGNKHNQVPFDQQNTNDPAEESQSLATGGILSDYEGLESSQLVVGLCPDMCPESEREERERKGDLDKFERLNGERNQTSKFLAVKKYNRTAEREADLIRPMSVLQKTVDYLLNLLDQPYTENFLSVYNFLWDRMRAIRMDLRMQHIFNQEAILMLEQMIRFHIVAMHELCEYKKGEGLSEGFDAHLNIEQMNKTSVDLFQMYEDHRKKGIGVPTEKEFRGYYALLKLDKHPGYKVEPAELSLDLAKMTPEMRCTPEILFARDVARACRIGNYIAFFRLARKATYLQACLMHAHFGKLRTQALASLHSGLQNNQGIPISHVVKWLGMEGEDIESLLEYHGFSIRRYEEMYMVKEGPFLNSDTDFPTKCSQLVHLKKSRSIVDDVKFGQTLPRLTEEKGTVSDVVHMIDERTDTSKTEALVDVVEEEMLDFKADSSPRVAAQPRQLLVGPRPPIWSRVANVEMTEVSPPLAASISEEGSVSDDEQHVEDGLIGFVDQGGVTSMDVTALPKLEGNIVQAGVPGSSNFNCITENPVHKSDVGKSLENEAPMLVPRQKDEAFREKLKLILRKWKKRSAMKRDIREQREFLANAALSSLSLGPPIRRQSEAPPSHASGELNIDYVSRERYARRGKSWSRLNVSELIAPTLSTRNPGAKCICWKLVIFVQANDTETHTYNLASRWLLSKLMGTGKETDDELVVSVPHLSIWKKWNDTQISPTRTCCLSVIREAALGKNQPVCEDDLISGTSCFIFLVSESISWEIQKARLHELLLSIPSGSSMPLLILSSDPYTEDNTDPSLAIIKRLGLHRVDSTKINSYSVAFLTGNNHSEHVNGFFNDDQLREGLQWLASHSPLQPTVALVKTRELVLSNLRYSTEVLDSLKASEVGPDNCISAFNEALDRSAEEIISAASANPNQWPSPEIDLLKKPSDERVAADMYLPSIGWSSSARIKPLVRAIEGCKLPSFPNDMSWLKHGSPIGSQIQNQKLAIEECLISYLTHSTQLLNSDLAAREASVMLQKGAILELRGSCYHIVPRWVTIFQLIYNWRLLRLIRKEFSDAYILDNMDAMDSRCKTDAATPLKSGKTCMKDLENKFGLEGHQPLHSVHTELSLDELIGISCSDPFTKRPQSVDRHQCSPPEIVPEVSNVSGADNVYSENNGDTRWSGFVGDASQSGSTHIRSEAPVSAKNDKRLAMLLEQCNRLQDMIAKKLAIYF